MSSKNSVLFPVFLIGLTVLFGGADLAKGSFFIGKHEGDMLHLLQIVFRMTDGQVPHFDFVTPIGEWAFLPISLLLGQGLPIGMALLASQVAVAILLLPAIWRVGASRLTGLNAYFYGAVTILIVIGLVPGADEQSVSFSMHYNRWAWALAFIAIPLALIEPRGPTRGWLDGGLIGLALAGMVMIKLTFFVCFLPGIAIALLLRRDWPTLVAAAIGGLAVALAVTLWHGPSYWVAYAVDLLRVVGSQIRSYPGLPINEILAAPAYLGSTIVSLATVILLRQGGREREGLALLIILPGFAYVTYQNFGNDPKWLALLAVLIFALRPAPGLATARIPDLRLATTVAGWMTVAFVAPSVFNLAYSPWRHLNAPPDQFLPIFPRDTGAELYVSELRTRRLDARIALETQVPAFAAAIGDYERKPAPAVFLGETLPQCQMLSGLSTVMDTIARDLEAAGYGSSRLFTADLIGGYWLFGDFRPLPHGAPWYYGGLPGFDAADYLLVPLCPINEESRELILRTVTERGIPMHEVHRTDTYILYAPGAEATSTR